MRRYDRFSAPPRRPYPPARPPSPDRRYFPSAYWGWSPTGWAGWGPGMEFTTFGGVPYYGPAEPAEPTPLRPDRSPTYGARGDEAIRHWAARYGYDHLFAVRPRGYRRR